MRLLRNTSMALRTHGISELLRCLQYFQTPTVVTPIPFQSECPSCRTLGVRAVYIMYAWYVSLTARQLIAGMDPSDLHEVELLPGGTALPHRVREVERTAERARDRQRALCTNAMHLGKPRCQRGKRPRRGRGEADGGGGGFPMSEPNACMVA